MEGVVASQRCFERGGHDSHHAASHPLVRKERDRVSMPSEPVGRSVRPVGHAVDVPPLERPVRASGSELGARHAG